MQQSNSKPGPNDHWVALLTPILPTSSHGDGDDDLDEDDNVDVDQRRNVNCESHKKIA